MTIGARHDFGRDWNEVETNWCFGVPLPIEPEKAWEALGVLEQLWPEYLGEVLARNLRGFPVMVHVIDDGLTLAACQRLEGFEDVLHRIKDGRQAALPEVRFAAILVKLGYQPVLDQEYHGKRPDARIVSENQEIFIDVVSPEMSDEVKQSNAIAGTLAQKLLEHLSQQDTNKRLELYLLTPNPRDISQEVCAFLGNPAIFPSEVVDEIPNIALIKYSNNPETEVPNVGPTISADTDLPIMGHGSTNQTRNSVTVRYPFTDDRFERMMSRKAKQLSKDEINLYVVDLSSVTGATKRWQPLARRRLQPEINRRFSAIILFFRYMDNNTGVFVQHCYIEQHPNPYKKLPERLLNDLRKLNTAPLS